MGGQGAVPRGGPISDADLVRLARLDAMAFGNWIANAASLRENDRYKVVPQPDPYDRRAVGGYDPETGDIGFKTSYMDNNAERFKNGDWLGEARTVATLLHEVRHAEQGPTESRDHPPDPGRGDVPAGTSE